MPNPCFSYPAEVPRRMPGGTCFSYQAGVPRAMPNSICFSYPRAVPPDIRNRDTARPGPDDRPRHRRVRRLSGFGTPSRVRQPSGGSARSARGGGIPASAVSADVTAASRGDIRLGTGSRERGAAGRAPATPADVSRQALRTAAPRGRRRREHEDRSTDVSPRTIEADMTGPDQRDGAPDATAGTAGPRVPCGHGHQAEVSDYRDKAFRQRSSGRSP